tara:strand:+ start:3483 stop:4193 length:711 start_codon:yes stop_codon:yes gene_type:complete
MANISEKKNFIGGLDQDKDERFLKEGDYRSALNFRNQSSETNSAGMLQNIPGTTEKSYTYPTGKPVISHGVNSFSSGLLTVDDSITVGHKDVIDSHKKSHGETVPKTVVYFLPGSMPAITGFGVDFFASKTTNKIGSDITFPAQAAFRGLTMNSIEGIVDVLKAFETSHKTDLSSKGINLIYSEKGVKISGVDLPCLVFTSTTDSDIFKIDVVGTEVNNGNLKKGFNFFVEEFKTK